MRIISTASTSVNGSIVVGEKNRNVDFTFTRLSLLTAAGGDTYRPASFDLNVARGVAVICNTHSISNAVQFYDDVVNVKCVK